MLLTASAPRNRVVICATRFPPPPPPLPSPARAVSLARLAMTSWAPGCRLVASALTLAILLHVTGAGTAAFLPKIRLFSSASGATVPEEYDCKKNKTVLIGDLVKVAQQDKIFLTLEGQSALRFTRNVQAHVTDGSPAKASKPVCFQSCAVVGNGGVLQLSSFGANIDSHTVRSPPVGPPHMNNIQLGK